MNTTTLADSSLTAEWVNPLIVAVRTVFETILDCRPERVGLTLKDERFPEYQLSAVISVTGRAVGTIVLSLARETALNVLHRMVGIEAPKIDADVRDAVGELANMMAGQAKSQLEHLQLTIAIPSIVEGRNHSVYYPSALKPIAIRFNSEIGPFAIEVGFKNSHLD